MLTFLPPPPPARFRKQVGHLAVMEVCTKEPILKKYILGHGGAESYANEIPQQFKSLLIFCQKRTPPCGCQLQSWDEDGVCVFRWNGKFKK